MLEPKIVYIKIYRPEHEDNPYAWLPIEYSKIWLNKIHDVEWRRKPPKYERVDGVKVTAIVLRNEELNND